MSMYSYRRLVIVDINAFESLVGNVAVIYNAHRLHV